LPFLKVNISKAWVKAKAGDEVTVISYDHFPVLIVETKDKVRFSVMDNELGNLEIKVPVIETKPAETETKSQNTTPTLF
jgi:hypothetical protein